VSDLTNFEEEVSGWIAEWLGVPRSSVTADTRVNVDLGVDGDDAFEMLQYLTNRAGISFATLEHDRYFGPEGFPWARIIDWMKGRRQWALEPLTVAMLAQYMSDERQHDADQTAEERPCNPSTSSSPTSPG
jgi:acyl carrier protein